MIRSEFTKTSNQVNEEIGALITEVQRSLDVSQGEVDRKGQAVFSVVLSLLLFVCIFAFDSLLKTQQPAAKPVTDAVFSSESHLTKHDVEQLEVLLGRIDEQLESAQLLKNKVAPSLGIDPQISSIKNNVADVRRLLGISQKPSSGAEAH